MVASVKFLEAATATVEYFEAEGYYARGDPEHRRASRWYGGLAEEFGLRNRMVTAKRFAAVLEGHVPGTGIRLGRMRDGAHQHRPGIDVTFSAPKSVSLEALLHAPPRTRARILNAHDAAVRAACDLAQREFLWTRTYDRATRRRPRVAADGLLAALFRHVASRNLDPQLHTHSVFANMTRGPDGRWRSADFTLVNRAKRLLGAHYRAELQQRLAAMGYATVRRMIGDVPGFEIAGYPRALLDHFSSRRRDILQWLEERGIAYTAAAAQQATLFTRRRKAEPARGELEAIWRRRAEAFHRRRDARATRLRHAARTPPPLSALEAARQAVGHLEERRTAFSRSELRGWALAWGGGGPTLGAIDAAVDQLARDGHLVELPADGVQRAYTTRGAVAAEREVVRRMRAGIGAGRPLAQGYLRPLADSTLNPGQRRAVDRILGSRHRIVGVQGFAGTGKTTMLREVVRFAGDVPVVGLAPSTAAARLLAREAGIPARTLQGFLGRHAALADQRPPPGAVAAARKAVGGAILVVDEASMIGTIAMRRLLRIAEAAGVARVALVGDRRQLRSVEQGQPFALLQRRGMPTAVMNRVLRQRDPALREAVRHLIDDEPALAIDGLGERVVEVGGDGDGDIVETAARLWLDLDPERRRRALLIAPTHALRAEVHAAIRRGLADEGALRGAVLELDRFVSLGLTRTQLCDPVHYREGDVAVFHHRDYGVGIEAGEPCRVLEVRDGQVSLERPDGETRVVEPRPGFRLRYRFDLYETVPIELRAGDRIRWTRNLRRARLDLANGDLATIERITRDRVRFRADDGAGYSLRRNDPHLHHLDHAYTSTVHAAQGQTADFVIAVLQADHGPLVDRTSFYVELTRARDDAVVLTDDRDALVESLEAPERGVPSVLDALGIELEDPPAAADGEEETPVPALPDRAGLWPEPLAWHAFAEPVRDRGGDPFGAPGAEAALEPVLALAASAPAGMPAEVASIAADHGRWRAAQARQAEAEERQRAIEAEAEERQRAREAEREAARQREARSRRLLREQEVLREQFKVWMSYRRFQLEQVAGRLAPASAADGAAMIRRKGGELLERTEAWLAETRAEPGPDPEARRRELRAQSRAVRRALAFDDRADALLAEVRRVRGHAAAPRWLHEPSHPVTVRRLWRLAAVARAATPPWLVRLPPELGLAYREDRLRTRGYLLAARAMAMLADARNARRRHLQAAAQAQTWVGDLPGHGDWLTGAKAAVAASRPLLAAEGLRQLVVEATSDGDPDRGRRNWEKTQGTAADLGAAIARDDRALALLRTRRSLALLSRVPGRRPMYYRKGYPALISGIHELDRTAAPGEMPPELATALRDHAVEEARCRDVQAFLRTKLPDLGALVERRDAMARSGAHTAIAYLEDPDYPDWKGAARRLAADAQELLDDPERRPHLAAAGAVRRVKQALRPVREALAYDGQAEGITSAWSTFALAARDAGEAPFFRDGYDRLIRQVRALDRALDRKRGTQPRLPLLDEALADDAERAALQRRLRWLVRRIRKCTRQRRDLLSIHVDPDKSVAATHDALLENWNQLGAQAEEAIRELLADPRYRDHIERTPGAERVIAHAQFAIELADGLQWHPARLLLALDGHAARCAHHGCDPCRDPGLQRIIDELDPWPNQLLRPDDTRERAAREAAESLRRKRWLRGAPNVLRDLAESRAALERKAKANGRRLFDEPGYRAWGIAFDRCEEKFYESLGHNATSTRRGRWPDLDRSLDEVRRQFRTWNTFDHSKAMEDVRRERLRQREQRGQAIRRGLGQERPGVPADRPRSRALGPAPEVRRGAAGALTVSSWPRAVSRARPWPVRIAGCAPAAIH